MAELQHDRTLGQTATHILAVDGRGPFAADAVVSIRQWINGDDQSPSELLAETLSPAACLTVDTLVASGGTVIQGQGRNLIATFPDVSTGILAARRLQWAFEGLSEAGQFAGSAVAVVVHSSKDLPDKPSDDAISAPLEYALRGQILLSENASRLLDDLHVMTCEPTPNPAYHALAWRQSESPSSGTADEQILFRNIKEQGDRDAGPSAEAIFESWDILSGTEEELPGKTGAPPGVLKRSPWLIWGGSAFAVVFAVGVIAIALHRAPVPPPPAPIHTIIATPPVQVNSVPKTPSPLPEKPAVVIKPAAVAVSKPDFLKAAPKKTHEDPETQSTGACDMPQVAIARVLNRANTWLHAGKLDDAERAYKNLLGCDKSDAQAGLQQVRARRQAER
jgi:hypothetical protein